MQSSSILGFLENKLILVTGTTGFLAKSIVIFYFPFFLLVRLMLYKINFDKSKIVMCSILWRRCWGLNQMYRRSLLLWAADKNSVTEDCKMRYMWHMFWTLFFSLFLNMMVIMRIQKRNLILFFVLVWESLASIIMVAILNYLRTNGMVWHRMSARGLFDCRSSLYGLCRLVLLPTHNWEVARFEIKLKYFILKKKKKL